MKQKTEEQGREFGRRLVVLMTEKKLSVRKAAAAIAVSDSTVQDWRNGACPRDFRGVKRLADLLGVPFEGLLIGDGE